MSPEEFARFLEHLSPDAEEAGRLYTRLHKKLVGFFHLKGVSEPGMAADETLDRAAVKICAGTPVPDVTKYCLGIARNVVKEWLRREQREKSVFQRFVEDLSDDSDEEIARIERVLKPCFEQLSDDERELLLGYCQVLRGRARAEHRRELAETKKTTVLALRMRVTRLRGILGECVEKRSREHLAAI
jgi:DNA-directed RNA polymerase specialized sigma24 family protein